jgi:hypothetical protein
MPYADILDPFVQRAQDKNEILDPSVRSFDAETRKH